jgi:uncharacterized protein YceH (UPF0502 family)
MELSAPEVRVVGCLIEKQLSTPTQYPLTLNALMAACNQTTSREPVVRYEEHTVEGALQSLKEARLVRFVLPSHGRSVVRYRQVLDERLALDDRQLALLAVLTLRGPQTIGELRAHTDRMASFDDLAGIEHDLGLLADHPERLATRQERRAGHKEARWVHLLGDPPPPDVAPGEALRPDPLPGAPAETPGGALEDRVRTLESEVAELRGALEALRDELGA